ncbi:MAG: hypothetical protein PHQ23_11000 [Candidatus Wallbacteria bacterium]|nr:hypothetical protein [Candidatus Wallbacteria bacterium]
MNWIEKPQTAEELNEPADRWCPIDYCHKCKDNHCSCRGLRI